MTDNSEIVFKKADASYIDRLVDIRFRYIASDFGEISVETHEKIASVLPGYYRDHIGRDFTAFIAEKDDEIIASAFMVTVEKPANPSFTGGKVGIVMNVFTRDEYRRRGLASTLVKMLIDDAKANGCDRVELNATEDGFPMYKKIGFREITHQHTAMKYKLTE